MYDSAGLSCALTTNIHSAKTQANPGKLWHSSSSTAPRQLVRIVYRPLPDGTQPCFVQTNADGLMEAAAIAIEAIWGKAKVGACKAGAGKAGKAKAGAGKAGKAK